MSQEQATASDWASLIVEDIEETLFSVDTSWRFTYLNQRAAAAFAQAKEALVGKVLWEAFPSLIGSKFELVYRQAMAEGIPKRIEDFSATTQSWYDVRAYPIPQGLIVYFQDITTRKQAETALQLSEERFKVLSEAAYEALLIHENGSIVEANQRAAEMSGYERDELIGMSIEQLVAPEFLTAVREGLATTRAYRGESIAVRKDGTRFLIESRGKIIDYQGRPMRFVAVRDITERKRAEEQQAFLAAIVESSEDAIIGKTLEGIILSWNTGAEALYGYTAEEVIGRPINLLVPADRPDEVAAILDKIRQGECILHYETRRVRKNGTVVDVALTISPIRDTAGRIIGASTIARNVTERKRLETQLMQAQKMESIGRLAGGIAHDFNNLLTAIISYADLVAFNLDTASQGYSDALEIQKAGKRAAALTRQLLAFSRQQVLESRPLNLNTIVSEMDKLLHRVLGEDIEQVSLLEPDLAPALADPSQIEQVILNLAVNARDAMPNGGQLTIETANVVLDEQYRVERHFEVKTGSYVMLAVSDTGTGMDQSTREQIFEPFFTTKGIGQGTGLGLATVYGIVKQSGGAVWVYSELGVGTTFKIYLPRTDTPLLTQPPTIHQPLIGIARQNYTILVVEDDAMVRELVHRVLKQAGYATLDAQNGQEALDLVRAHQHQIDLIVTDIVMPRMTGRELVAELKHQGAQLKVLCMSGYTDQAVIRHGILQQCDIYLQKPFTPETLLRRIDELLSSTV